MDDEKYNQLQNELVKWYFDFKLNLSNKIYNIITNGTFL